jgi:hypothetical protein
MALTKTPSELTAADLTITTAAQPNITSLGTLTTLTIDDITINGSTISDGGDLTIDVAGNIILDADGGEIKFQDGGTDFARIFQSSGNFYLNVPTQDTDLIIQGNDGGSNVSALTFDMSDAGAAQFNSRVGIGVAAHATAGLNVTADGSNQNIRLNNGSELGIIDLDSDGNLKIWAHGDENIRFFNGTGTGIELMRIQNTGITQFFTGDGNSGVAEFHTNASSGSATAYISIRPQGSAKGYIGNGSSLLSGADATDFIVRSEANLVLNSGGNQESVRLDNAGHVTMPLQPSFVAPLSGGQPNISSETTVTFTEIADRNGDFSSSVFTAPVTGLYQLNCWLRLQAVPADISTYLIIRITVSNRNFDWIWTTTGFDATQTYMSTAQSVLVDMDANDTAKIVFHQSGGTTGVLDIGDGNFSGYLVC